MLTRFQKLFAAIIVCIFLFPAIAAANIPYETNYFDPNMKEWLKTQPLYVPVRVIAATSGQVKLFEDPSDLFITPDDLVYVVDKSDDCIVELDASGQFIRRIGAEKGEGKLNLPEGVFVKADGTVYVADTGDNRIAVFDNKGNFLRAFEKPKSQLLPEDYLFIPSKIVVDPRGVMYVDVKGSYQGLVRMKPNGEFAGFFGANKVELTWLEKFKKSILNKEQLGKETANLPGIINNVTIDRNGFLITSNEGVSSGQIKELNAGGVDSLGNKVIPVASQLVDVAVDKNGFLYSFDLDKGKIAIYDTKGNVLFTFAGMDSNPNQMGVFNYPTSIAINSKNEIWVSDSASKIIQVFGRTQFGDTILSAAELYYKGNYEESKPYWEQITAVNDMINLSYEGLGKVALEELRYKDALHYFKISYYKEGYSDAFWSIRLEWIQHYSVIVLIACIFIMALGRLLIRRGWVYVRKINWHPRILTYAEEIKDAGYVMFHPYEGFYRLKERRISYLIPLLILLLAGAAKLVYTYAIGFIFNPVDLSRINPYQALLTVFIPWVTWVIANYLISTIKDGEGRFREVFQASTYALVPYIVFALPIILISNIVVLEESILVVSLHQLMMLWMIVLFFVMTQVIHNFEFLETGKNVIITIFTVIVIWLFIIIASALSYNLWDFFNQIYREVKLHV